MGFALSNLFERLMGKEEIRILMVGLDGAGKTTTLHQMKIGPMANIIPTIGFNVEVVEYKNLRFTVWDIGGQQRIRDLWHHYFVNTVGVIFVVDVADTKRLPEAALELHLMLERQELCNAVLLVCANKQDLPNALHTSEIEAQLALHSVKQEWHVHGTSAKCGNGIYNGLEYLREMLIKRKKCGN
ncbi:ADP-ribosylation factor 4 [Ceratitis capitata]|nr:ADP-ribosylation factor 4 [Ceratitis capitata]